MSSPRYRRRHQLPQQAGGRQPVWCRPQIRAAAPRYCQIKGHRVREAVITIEELGEFGLIAAIRRALPASAGLVVGIGDDAAVLKAPDGRVVATTDMLIEGRHFRREWSSAADIGRKAAARNLADIAAMGAWPTGLLVAFAAPGDLSADWAIELVNGIAQECAAAGSTVVGGDTSGADVVMLAITALGDLRGRDPLTRSGAKPGDVVAVAGTLGSAAAGVALLSAGLAPDSAGVAPVGAGHSGAALADLVRAHRRPQPPYEAGPEAARLGATSLIDISDGLLADLGHVAEASGVRIELMSGPLGAEPVCRVSALRQAAALLSGSDWWPWVLAGGDDHALVATFPARLDAPDAPELPERWTVIGRVTAGRGVLVDGRIWTESGGWEHFRA
jgi:thiamine-monophosphate kinase